MGLDLSISAERNAIAPIQGKMKAEQHFRQEVTFSEWNPNSTQIRNVLAAQDPIAEYIKIIKEMNVIIEEEIFDEDDIPGELSPIVVKEVNLSDKHISTFKAWLNFCDENGFVVKLSAI